MIGKKQPDKTGRNEARDGDRPASRQSTTSAVEWIVAAAGVILFMVMLSYMLFVAISDSEGPPVPVISSEPAKPSKTGFVIDYEVSNEGESAAAQVVVTGQLLLGDRIVEERHGLIDYVPQDSRQQGSLIFQRDPRCCKAMVSVSSFTLP